METMMRRAWKVPSRNGLRVHKLLLTHAATSTGAPTMGEAK